MADGRPGVITRRELIGTASRWVLGCAALPAFAGARTVRAADAEAESIVVETSAGNLRGAVAQGIRVFKGIPYGPRTGGAARFLPPGETPRWSNVLDALGYGPRCPQVAPRGEGASAADPTAELFTPKIASESGARAEAQSENCLMLNVWTPGTDRGKRPVLVWLHGGGFATGSGASPLYDGVNLCKRGDVVLVTVNHRLHAFGHLYLGELAGEEYAASGNAGMLDLIAALGWVRDHIVDFGGDPRNVTLFGESGGGHKVSALLAMPSAKGLFQRAIIQSGPGLQMQPRDRASELALELLSELGLRPNAITELLAVPADRLVAAQAAVAQRQDSSARERGALGPRGFVPTVDGKLLPTYPFDPVAPQVSADVPLLIGTNQHETAYFLARDPEIYGRTLTEEALKARAEKLLGEAAGPALSLYKKLYPKASPGERFILMTTDRTYRIDSIALAQRKYALGRAPVYMYLFRWRRPNGRLLAHHSLEVPFVFANTANFPNLTGEGASGGGVQAAALAERMCDAWIAFARTGNPGTPKLPAWPVYTPSQRATLIFDNECRLENDPGAAERHLWSTV